MRSALIPVAGLGTRLLPATRSQPKEMLPVLDKPVVQFVVEELAAAGIERVLFVTGRRKRAIEDHFDLDPALIGTPVPGAGLEILYTRQPRPAGLGDALARGRGFAGTEPVVVALGDSIVEPAQGAAPGGLVRRLIDARARAGACAAVAVAQVPDELVERYGIVVPGDLARPGPPGSEGEAFAVADVVEKPSPGEVASRCAVMGRYVLGPSVLAELQETAPDRTGEVQLADALRARLRAGERVVAVGLAPGERRHDIGTVAAYAEVFLRYALRDPRFGPELRDLVTEMLADHAG